MVFLVDVHGWQAAAAGRIVAAGQLGGAVLRLVSGWWSDRAGSRMRPMRTLTVAIALALAGLAACAAARSATAGAVVMVATVVSVSTNGLAYTTVAEYAGSSWAGKAGIQNTAQYVVATATPPGMATRISATGYPAAFTVGAVAALLAVATIPVRGEHRAADPPPTPETVEQHPGQGAIRACG
ncbi:MFS transporter [Streptomyces sp. NPDC101225]|uniref:MFS transporter n=1 Tax=Streptomyces sp. NPDC101225 TaxID=3366135 RepID=UPI0038012B8F